MRDAKDIKAEIFDLAEERGEFEKTARERIEGLNKRIAGLYEELEAVKAAPAPEE